MGVGCDVNYYVCAEIFMQKDLEILMFRCPTMQFFCCILLVGGAEASTGASLGHVILA
jgi:hypothetical protein